MDEVELLLSIPLTDLVVVVDDPVAWLATDPGVDAERCDPEVVSNRPRSTAAVADLLDLVEVGYCVATHRASCVIVWNRGIERRVTITPPARAGAQTAARDRKLRHSQPTAIVPSLFVGKESPRDCVDEVVVRRSSRARGGAMSRKVCVVVVVVIALAAAGVASAVSTTSGPLLLGPSFHISQIAFEGYYDGHKDSYLITDVSSKSQAAALHINYSAALASVISAPAQYFVKGRAAAGQITVFGLSQARATTTPSGSSSSSRGSPA
jgi:hypothetical protein